MDERHDDEGERNRREAYPFHRLSRLAISRLGLDLKPFSIFQFLEGDDKRGSLPAG